MRRALTACSAAVDLVAKEAAQAASEVPGAPDTDLAADGESTCQHCLLPCTAAACDATSRINLRERIITLACQTVLELTLCSPLCTAGFEAGSWPAPAPVRRTVGIRHMSQAIAQVTGGAAVVAVRQLPTQQQLVMCAVARMLGDAGAKERPPPKQTFTDFLPIKDPPASSKAHETPFSKLSVSRAGLAVGTLIRKTLQILQRIGISL